LGDIVLVIRGTLGGVWVGVQLEAGAGIVAGLYVIAGEAGEGDTTTWRITGIAIAGVVWLLADI